MTDQRKPAAAADARSPGRILGSLRDALMAASRTDTADAPTERPPAPAQRPAAASGQDDHSAADTVLLRRDPPPASEVAREARLAAKPVEPAPRPVDPPTQHVRASAPAKPAETQLVRGKVEFGQAEFHQDPVVGWLVVVGGSGVGAFRPIFECNNSIGRARNQRIPVDFGDESISSEEQAFIRYDSVDRSFLFVPNLSKTNVVSINNKKPTGAVPLNAMDVITMGRTQLAFVPFCGAEFDWSELGEAKG